MALDYTICPERGYVNVIGTGKQTMPEMVAAVDAVVEDPQFDSNFIVLFDLRGTSYTAELRDGDDFVKALKRRMPDLQNKFALVVPEHLQPLAKLYTILAAVSGFNRSKCFIDIDKAKAWCGLQD